ncbi:hypothetical protein N7491_011010 [Penicillium cf. griseofulvum]|uniref:Uncharacterized protein n=1 Tax=Penicillium cf. griseofulvum TaxID=2972120 RepID=A0A9W9T7A9_9EURO|nr:hypothetical protein N7472_001329 [Penicillium cf. griseofulvum]KAJ5422565.1 hypothetical protein N7491_011010 [Penicillium cf. griseofulvum]
MEQLKARPKRKAPRRLYPVSLSKPRIEWGNEQQGDEVAGTCTGFYNEKSQRLEPNKDRTKTCCPGPLKIPRYP